MNTETNRNLAGPINPGVNPRPRKSHFARSQRMTIVTGILVLEAIIVVLQLWLFTATLNAYLGGDSSTLVPAAIASIICLLLNFGLLRYLIGMDR